MAKEITVTFDDGGVYEGFANTYTLNNAITYYFSFDRDYRVQVTNNAITLQEYRNAGAWYPIDIITAFEVSEISGGGDVTKQWVEDNFQPKGEYITKVQADLYYQPKGDYLVQSDLDIYATKQWVEENFSGGGTGDVTKKWVQDNFVLKAGDTMTGALNFKFGDNVALSIAKYQNNNRAVITLNGSIACIRNDGTRTLAIYSGTTGAGSIVLYGNYGTNQSYSYLSLCGHPYNASGGDNTYISMNYNQIVDWNRDKHAWNVFTKFSVLTDIFLKGNAYLDSRLFVRDPANNDKINATINTAGQFDTYGDNAYYSCNRYNYNGSGASVTYRNNGVTAINYTGLILTFNAQTGSANINSDRSIELNAPYLYGIAPNGTNFTSNNGNIVLQDSKGVMGRSTTTEVNTYIQNTTNNVYVKSSQTPADSSKRDELTALLDLFQIVYNILEDAGIPGASKIAQYTSDVVLWIYDNQDGVLKPTVTKIRNLIHN